MSYYKIFKDINAIPRPSHHEGQIADFLCRFADTHGLEWQRDSENCVVIRKPASPGYENHEPLVILNHCDMVCVAEEGKRFNPLRDAIEAETVSIDGERWMRAKGTSLGADNGIGLAMALAILADKTMRHPQLEVLTTTNEEDGMSGAERMSPDFIKGRRVLNLDSEAYDEITVGAAGAFMQTARLPYTKQRMPEGYLAYNVSVSGGKGGHSGVDIVRNRANAIKVLANLLLVAIRQCDIKLYLVNFNGGTAAASIPSSASAKVVLPKDDARRFESLVTQCDEELERQYAGTDGDVTAACEASVWKAGVVSEEATHLLLAAINGIPAGPIEMLDTQTAMTSNNIGRVVQKDNMFEVSTHTRSFDNAAMENIAMQIRKIFELSGADVETVMKAPAWKEDPDNSLVNITCKTFEDVLGFTPKKVAMHFVLEAGFLVEKFPGLHIASIGPRIVEPHSVQERVQLSTVDNIWRVVTELLGRL
ncbi:MAG: beta-Ala-His dipeptidase [Bacteroidales bacterium]|nr:beta-Ala-His dipeptidase [Bacteroidales bacterium]